MSPGLRTRLRHALRLDEPALHLGPAQFALACLIALQSACLWAAVARDLALLVVIFPLLLPPAWLTPRERETPLFRLAWSNLEGALIAAFMTLARRVAGL